MFFKNKNKIKTLCLMFQKSLILKFVQKKKDSNSVIGKVK